MMNWTEEGTLTKVKDHVHEVMRERDKLYLDVVVGLHWWNWGLGAAVEYWSRAECLKRDESDFFWNVRMLFHVGPIRMFVDVIRT